MHHDALHWMEHQTFLKQRIATSHHATSFRECGCVTRWAEVKPKSALKITYMGHYNSFKKISKVPQTEKKKKKGSLEILIFCCCCSTIKIWENTSEFHAGRWSWLPGQGWGLQSWYSIADPTQGKPPFLGSGFVHVLFLILKPSSQSLEQEDQAPQKDQPPLIIRAEVLPVLRRSSTRASRKTNKTP